MRSKQRIIEAAISIFASKGKHGTTMEEIAKKAEINKAMLYYYYSTKENLFKEVLKIIMTSISNDVIDNINKMKKKKDSEKFDPVKTIGRIIKFHMDTYKKNKDYAKIFLEALADDENDFILVVEEIKKEKKMDLLEEMISTLDDGIAKKAFRKINSHQVAISIIGLNMIYFFGKPIASAFVKSKIENEDKFIKEREESIVDLLLYGIINKR
jgi:TetR/AcrR family transcriptional regulator